MPQLRNLAEEEDFRRVLSHQMENTQLIGVPTKLLPTHTSARVAETLLMERLKRPMPLTKQPELPPRRSRPPQRRPRQKLRQLRIASLMLGLPR